MSGKSQPELLMRSVLVFVLQIQKTHFSVIEGGLEKSYVSHSVLTCQNLTTGLDWQQLSLRFWCVTLVSANVASSRDEEQAAGLTSLELHTLGWHNI